MSKAAKINTDVCKIFWKEFSLCNYLERLQGQHQGSPSPEWHHPQSWGNKALQINGILGATDCLSFHSLNLIAYAITGWGLPKTIRKGSNSKKGSHIYNSDTQKHRDFCLSLHLDLIISIFYFYPNSWLPFIHSPDLIFPTRSTPRGGLIRTGQHPSGKKDLATIGYPY